MPVTLTAPESKEQIVVLSATETLHEVRERVPWPALHQNYLSILVKKGQFPAPWITLGGRNGWLKQDVDEWITDRSQGARQKALEEAVSLTKNMKGRELDAFMKEWKQKVLEAE